MTHQEVEKLNILVLSFVGDSVFSLYVRKKLAEGELCKIEAMHKKASEIVSAGGQSKFVEILESKFTEAEKSVYMRARNCKNHAQPKSFSVAEYRRATGFEAVLGWLYLLGESARIDELLLVLEF